jgi:hypothetical protein
MLSSRRISVAVGVSVVFLLALLCSSVAASAAPITVNVRIEGSVATLYEGPVATSGETFETLSSGGAHPCNYSSNGPPGGFADEGTPSGTPTTALHDAALASGLPFDAQWFGSGPSNGDPGDFFVTKVGTDENGGAPTFPSWGYAVNYTTAIVGGCQIALAPGSEVLWAYNYFNLTHLLDLAGPAIVGSGAPFTVHVVDGRTGEPITGASIGELASGVTTAIPSSPLTDASGNATISLPDAGTFTLKATQAESVRSQGLLVCVHSSNDGSCGTTVSSSDSSATPGAVSSNGPAATGLAASVVGIVNGHAYSRSTAPRVLKGSVKVAAGGTLRQVRIRIQRRVGRRCSNYSGARERFVRSPKCSPASFFSVGSSQSFSYLLPARLPAGRYAYDIEAVEASGNVTRLVGGVSHVVFRVK